MMTGPSRNRRWNESPKRKYSYGTAAIEVFSTSDGVGELMETTVSTYRYRSTIVTKVSQMILAACGLMVGSEH